MDTPPPYYQYNSYQQVQPPKKKTSVVSWLGFGISLAVLFLILVSSFAAASSNFGNVESILMIVLMLFVPIGLLGLIFSIVGLFLAIKNDTPKWIGAWGIIFCCLCGPAIIVGPVAKALLKGDKTEIIEIETPDEAASDVPDWDISYTE